ncbi:uncharacterized protein PHACADRAFT_250101 [Phanerochaete carnosa HHB-10118-sp]|uniref:Glycosyltransferase family 1 protein n=1 Tax=Phanerochaete carnosa (strain HHB-10118-sp) TaxID=650164 RepID=K5W6H9_PHACS|nr:uncharacterized protein PHACADRAFT_250101 [Phanerochaete carnosa HHB-10118-sp]EKM59533.1 hypothetical protein PHACADRAFT_250101 [Phanerochaete carnosa HHB-10118-sp]
MVLATRRSVVWACPFFLVLLVVCTTFVIDIEWNQLIPASPSSVALDGEYCLRLSDSRHDIAVIEAQVSTQETTTTLIKRKHVLVASFFGFHFDVYMTLAWTLKRVLMQVPQAQIELFAAPFYYGFEAVVGEYGLYDGVRRDPEELLSYIQSNTTVDTVVLGTCEIDLNQIHSALLDEWDKRAPEEKFKLVCMVHNVQDTPWQANIGEWSRRGAIRLVTLGEHVGKSFRNMFEEIAEEPLGGGGYEYIPIDLHIPVLDVSGLPAKSANRSLARAVIQGSFDTTRRSYYNFFDELIRSLHRNPEAWGYNSLSDRASFVPNYQSLVPPFELALVGSGSLEVPQELAYMVSIHRGLDYANFYDLVASMDIVVPAFADNGYYEHQASSTVAMAVELDVPILATRRMRKAYGYIDDDRAVVTRPAAMSEVQALLALRTGSLSYFLEQDPDGVMGLFPPLRALVNDMREMVNGGWVRDPADLRRYKERLWRNNEEVVERLLADM